MLAIIHRHLFVQTASIRLDEVTFRRAAPTDAGPWQAAFGTHPAFRHAVTSLRFAAAALRLPLRTANAELHRFAVGPVRRRSRARSRLPPA